MPAVAPTDVDCRSHDVTVIQRQDYLLLPPVTSSLSVVRGHSRGIEGMLMTSAAGVDCCYKRSYQCFVMMLPLTASGTDP